MSAQRKGNAKAINMPTRPPRDWNRFRKIKDAPFQKTEKNVLTRDVGRAWSRGQRGEGRDRTSACGRSRAGREPINHSCQDTHITSANPSTVAHCPRKHNSPTGTQNHLRKAPIAICQSGPPGQASSAGARTTTQHQQHFLWSPPLFTAGASSTLASTVVVPTLRAEERRKGIRQRQHTCASKQQRPMA